METSAEPKNKNARTCTYTPKNTRYVVDLSINLKLHLYFLPATSHDESRGHFDHIASAFTFPLDFFLDGEKKTDKKRKREREDSPIQSRSVSPSGPPGAWPWRAWPEDEVSERRWRSSEGTSSEDG